MQITEIWAETGQVIEREPTAAEAAQIEADAKANAATEKAKAKADAEAATARADAIAHAKTLGFTDAMIAVMYPGLTA
jgi:hypothetical protein